MKIIIYILLAVLFNSIPLKAQWVKITNGIGSDKNILAFTKNNTHVFAGTDSGVFRSTNNCESWTKTTLDNKRVNSLAFSGINLFAGTENNGLYLSTNSGDNWALVALSGKTVNALEVLGTNIIAGTMLYGIYLSTDNGVTWPYNPLTNKDVLSLTVYNNVIFAATNGGVYRSTSSGMSWNSTGLMNIGIYSVGSGNGRVFACTSLYGIFRTTNNGTDWTQTSLTSGFTYAFAAKDTNVFAGTYSFSVYYTSNNGTNWIQRSEGFSPGITVCSFILIDSTLFAGTWGNSLWKRNILDLITITSVKKLSSSVPESFKLSQNYPNPFNPSTTIKFDVANTSSSFPNVSIGNPYITLKIFNTLGREVAVLVNEKLSPGIYSVEWNASEYPSGIYFCRMQSGDYNEAKRLILIK